MSGGAGVGVDEGPSLENIDPLSIIPIGWPVYNHISQCKHHVASMKNWNKNDAG